jgi:hypothetical protein
MPATGTEFAAEVDKFLGVPYVWGGASPKGFDCSGLVAYGLGRLGIRAPRTSEAQWAWVQRIPQGQLQPGDLIFEQWPGEVSPGHVAIYAGSGQIIQAPAPGQSVQKVAWSPGIVSKQGGKIVGYGRVPGLTYAGEPASIAGKAGAGTAGGAGGGGAGPAGPAGATTAQLTAFLSAPSGVLADAGALLHGTAVVLDRAFALFAPGQGWRIVFGAAGLILLYLAYRAFGGVV